MPATKKTEQNTEREVPLEETLCLIIGHLTAAQRALFKGFRETDPEVSVPLQWANESMREAA